MTSAPLRRDLRASGDRASECFDKPMENNMKIRPLYDRILVKRSEEKQEMQGGLHIPDSAKEKPQEAEVMAVGQGKRLEDGKIVPLDVKVGDRVLLGKYSGSEIKLDGQELLIVREDEVLGILEGAAKLAKAS
jgi:chaperonin GroES